MPEPGHGYPITRLFLPGSQFMSISGMVDLTTVMSLRSDNSIPPFTEKTCWQSPADRLSDRPCRCGLHFSGYRLSRGDSA
jgi:hypothetical protein